MFIKDLQARINEAEKPLLVILGPTASGKTKLSLNLAKQLNGEIISTDSRQIYREMPIATDVIMPNEQEGVTHHMLEIVSPSETLTLAEFKDLATQKIEQIHQQNKLPILAGGTGLYVSAITQGYDVPKVAPNDKLRDQLEKEAEEHGNEFVHNKLKELDPQAAYSIHPNNLRYVIRAIEINEATGANKSDSMSQSPYNTFFLGITRPREELYERINARVDKQVERGLIEEVQALIKKGYAENLPSMSSLGVKEIIPYINREMDLSECLEILKRNTRRYCKRQLTWLKRYDNVHWLNPSEIAEILNAQ